MCVCVLGDGVIRVKGGGIGVSKQSSMNMIEKGGVGRSKQVKDGCV